MKVLQCTYNIYGSNETQFRDYQYDCTYVNVDVKRDKARSCKTVWDSTQSDTSHLV